MANHNAVQNSATSYSTVSVVIDRRFDRTPDGQVWTVGPFSYSFWLRYLDTYRHVRIIARVRDVDSVPSQALLVNGPNISVSGITYYVGPRQFIAKYQSILGDLQKALADETAVIVRLPGRLGSMSAQFLRRAHRPYGVELVGDPYDVFAPGSVKHFLRPILRKQSYRTTRRAVNGAGAVAYVTKYALQQRYPANSQAYTTYYSSIELPSEAIMENSRTYFTTPSPLRLVTIGSLEQNYKGTDTLLNALALLRRAGTDMHLTIVGGGKHLNEYVDLAVNLDIANQVEFIGQISSGSPVRQILDNSDIFVLPSRAEGLPRAMIEAMARALPCIGTSIGGIPELLEPDVIVPVSDAQALCNAILSLSQSPERMTAQSARNLSVAQDYAHKILQTRRTDFFTYLGTLY